MAGDQVTQGTSRRDEIAYHVLKRHLDAQPEQDARELLEWQTSPEIPTSGELMKTEPPYLPQNCWDNSPSKNQYLESQYWLTRFEGTELLRRAVDRIRHYPDMMEDSDFYIYTQCFVGIVAARYLNGGLEPNFQAGENENTPPRIEIFWGNNDNAILDPSIDLIMVEAKGGYYEPIQHVLVGLQHAALYESKFDKYIIDECERSYMTTYAQEAFPAVQTPTVASQFDVSQREAFNRMTSHELAIVQGPPGTGKTFTSIVAIQSYIQTLQANKGKDEPPTLIVVSAQTNHALDQLLERCIQVGANVARLGGRSQVPVIKERTMYNLEQGSKIRVGPGQGENTRKSIFRNLKDALSMCFPGGFITAEHLHREGLLSNDQFESLCDNQWETAAQPLVMGNRPESPESLGEPEDSFGGLIAAWLEDCVEQDQTYVYRPPQGQTEASPEGFENGQEYQAPDLEEDERQRLKGEFISTEIYWTGSVPGSMSSHSAWYFQGCKYLRKYSDLYQIKPPQRGMVYRCLRKQLIDKIAGQLPKLLKAYQDACNDIKITKWNHKVKILQDEGVEVLGCTTSGLTKYRGLISAMKPRILMIEEAAETREANITSALYPSLDQVVLVGDHQQLVPQVAVHELEQPPYHLNVSLFERLVNLNLPYSMLKVQRRMIPIIRSVVHTFYPELEDHDYVKDPRNRAPVPGMGGKNLWWFQHRWGENQNAEFSFYNMNEAAMIVGFVRYLVQNGVHPSQITVLTYYTGQVSTILKHLRRSATLSNYNPTKEWSVRTVDGFQGEENDIIILSLVRSPASGHNRPNAGFVKNENRAVVATSRARCGMYIFGNSNNLLASDPESARTWQKVYDVFEKEGCIGYKLPVVCKKHDRITELGHPSEWETIPGGGLHPTTPAKTQASGPSSSQIESPRGGGRGGGRGARGARGGARGGKRGKQPKSGQQAQRLLKSPPIQDRSAQGSSAQVQQHQHELTSEDLIELGYHAGLAEQDAQVGQVSENRATIRIPVLDSGTSVFESAPLSEESVSDKWSPRKVMEKERALQLLWNRENNSPTRSSTKIRQTFYPTTSDRSGRLQPIVMEHIFPAPQLRDRPLTVGSEANSVFSEQPSRKQLALDAASGFDNVDNLEGFALTSECRVIRQPEPERDQGAETDDMVMPLIQFD
ncbi:hypothetical protein G7Z17_g6403 [Cylindrodendrum hubeiense]|uniref:Uncharacterized protein n=1 Tax=Cylindrodendrum hubeiense TaxID=595255 RepID=A0A9P5H4R9_9HYPO|nr:hypothetical protein G7Z17_g6403 [Cylindrodendrum hubeiense]